MQTALTLIKNFLLSCSLILLFLITNSNANSDVEAKNPEEQVKDMLIATESSVLTSEKELIITELAKKIGLTDIALIERSFSYHPYNIKYLVFENSQIFEDGTSLQRYVNVADEDNKYSNLPANNDKIKNSQFYSDGVIEVIRRCKTPNDFGGNYIIVANELGCNFVYNLLSKFADNDIQISPSEKESFKKFDLKSISSLTFSDTVGYRIIAQTKAFQGKSIDFQFVNNRIVIDNISFWME